MEERCYSKDATGTAKMEQDLLRERLLLRLDDIVKALPLREHQVSQQRLEFSRQALPVLLVQIPDL